MAIAANRRGKITVFPESSLACFTLIVFLRYSTRYQLHAFRDGFLLNILDEQVNVVGRRDVVQHAQAVSLPGLE
jgi:hypothetical protein